MAKRLSIRRRFREVPQPANLTEVRIQPIVEYFIGSPEIGFRSFGERQILRIVGAGQIEAIGDFVGGFQEVVILEVCDRVFQQEREELPALFMRDPVLEYGFADDGCQFRAYRRSAIRRMSVFDQYNRVACACRVSGSSGRTLASRILESMTRSVNPHPHGCPAADRPHRRECHRYDSRAHLLAGR
ncbi:MAG: hypothetical protein U0521_09075 [Anaerolineae bacterium]